MVKPDDGHELAETCRLIFTRIYIFHTSQLCYCLPFNIYISWASIIKVTVEDTGFEVIDW